MQGKTVTVQLTARELSLLVNALNESREAVDEWEFEARLGVRIVEADELGRRLREVLSALGTPNEVSS